MHLLGDAIDCSICDRAKIARLLSRRAISLRGTGLLVQQ